MAEIICIIGNKGGTGKTTLSHMLCQGMGLLGSRSVCVLTDTCREPLNPDGRRYLTADARSAEALHKVVEKLSGLNAWKGVVDGGGNRTDVDRKLYGLANLVLLPFRDSHEDMRTVIRDLEQFPHAYALPSQWPTNPWQKEAAEKTLAQMMVGFEQRVLQPVFALSSTKLLLQKQIPSDLPTQLGNACRRLAHQVMSLMDASQEPMEEEPEQDQVQSQVQPNAAAEEPETIHVLPLPQAEEMSSPAPSDDAAAADDQEPTSEATNVETDAPPSSDQEQEVSASELK